MQFFFLIIFYVFHSKYVLLYIFNISSMMLSVCVCVIYSILFCMWVYFFEENDVYIRLIIKKRKWCKRCVCVCVKMYEAAKFLNTIIVFFIWLLSVIFLSFLFVLYKLYIFV